MNVGRKTAEALQAAEVLLCSAPQGHLDLRDVHARVEKALRLLAHEPEQWISREHARRLLGVSLDETVPTLARMELLRGRLGADGQLEVRLDDVLNQRLASEDLLAIGGDDLTEEELEELHESRPGTLPWEREQKRSSA
jgi:hypothetical protein